MKLYYNPWSRAAIAKWMLDECDADYEIVDIDLEKGEHKTPEFLEINPAGKLPALVDGDSRIFEAAAICLYLGDKFPEANLAPKIGASERGRGAAWSPTPQAAPSAPGAGSVVRTSIRRVGATRVVCTGFNSASRSARAASPLVAVASPGT